MLFLRKLAPWASGFLLAISAPAAAKDVLYHGNFCQPRFNYQNKIGYNQFGPHNNGTAAEKIECPFVLDFDGSLTVNKVEVTVYDRNAAKEVICTVRGVSVAGETIFSKTQSTLGSSQAAQFLNFNLNESMLGTLHMECFLPPKQGSALSHVSTYRLITTP